MQSHNIAAIFWNDHYYADRQALPGSPDDLLDTPTLSVGIVLDETEKSILLASTIEPDEDATYLVILKATIIAMKEFGKIELKALNRQR